jgi:hypothetical protein
MYLVDPSSGRHVTGFALVSRLYQQCLALCDSTPPFPGPSIALPMTPNIYYQQQPCLTNNFQVFTELRHVCYQLGSGKTRSRYTRNCIVSCYWLLLEMVG